MTQESLLALGVTEPKVFAAWSFYDHHMQYTPMAFGPEAVFDSSAYYKVNFGCTVEEMISLQPLSKTISTKLGERVGPRLLELAPAARGSQEAA